MSPNTIGIGSNIAAAASDALSRLPGETARHCLLLERLLFALVLCSGNVSTRYTPH